MENRTFIGMGNNPDGPDLPTGFSMNLGQEPQAIANYGKLTKDQQASIIRYIQDCVTGDDARNRIEHAVHCLKENNYSGIFS